MSHRLSELQQCARLVRTYGLAPEVSGCTRRRAKRHTAAQETGSARGMRSENAAAERGDFVCTCPRPRLD